MWQNVGEGYEKKVFMVINGFTLVLNGCSLQVNTQKRGMNMDKEHMNTAHLTILTEEEITFLTYHLGDLMSELELLSDKNILLQILKKLEFAKNVIADDAFYLLYQNSVEEEAHQKNVI